MHHRASHLNFNHIEINELNIHSYESGIYLVEVDCEESHGFIYNENNEHLRKFANVNEVKDTFNECRIKQAFLVQESAYDEMCGTSNDLTTSDNQLKVEVKFN